jgi:hypothetical protein
MLSPSDHTAAGALAGLGLGNTLQHQLSGWLFPPEYAGDFRGQLESLRQAGNVCERTASTGRFRWAKRILAKFFRPFFRDQSDFNQRAVNQLACLFDLLSTLLSSRSDLRAVVSADVKEWLGRLRTELFLEVRGMSLPPSQGTMEEARVYSLSRSMGDAPRIHLGAAAGRREGYLNVDDVPGAEVELLSPLDCLPVRPATVAELVATHVIERFPVTQVVRRLLPHWVALLREGGRLVLVTTDLEEAAESLRQGRLREEEFVNCLFGPQARPSDSHRSAFTPHLLSHYAAAAGLERLRVTWRRYDKDRATFAFQLEGSKGAA